jgi:hypothetical protein
MAPRGVVLGLFLAEFAEPRGARGATLALRDLAVVNAAVSGDRGPPNSCSLAERTPRSLAWARRWNLLVAELQDPANDQRDQYRQHHQRHDERHPYHEDRGGPVSDVHAITYPSQCHRNRTVTCGGAVLIGVALWLALYAALVVDGALVLVLAIVTEVVVAHRPWCTLSSP